jgi:phosphoribosylformylglycinamidine synthase
LATRVRVLVLRAAGINCDAETVFAWEQAGAAPELLHINQLMQNPSLLRDYHALTFPGGFSYGDDIAAGKVFANQLVHHLGDELRRFVNQRKLVLGICNGFQVLVKAGLLPGGARNGNWQGRVTIGFNEHGRFEDRWVHLRAEASHSPWLEPGEIVRFPIAHAEGRVLTDSDETLDRLRAENLVALRYVDAEGRYGEFPVNPNGSVDHVAGLTDPTGRVLGLMPHPERNAHARHDPLAAGDPSGRRIFSRAVDYLRAF